MFLIVCHHFVVNSGLTYGSGPLSLYPNAYKSLYLWMFGMWGKTGINCFMLITGYFMCEKQISLRKFLKLMLWMYFYNIVIYIIFLLAGYETTSFLRILTLVMPIWGIRHNFTSCFIVFWLSIPFWNVLIHHLSRKQHQYLLILFFGVYSVFGTIPKFLIDFNYWTWFGIIYCAASYIRLYPSRVFDNKQLWMWLSFLFILASYISVIVMGKIDGGKMYYFVSDSNKFLPSAVAISTFLWFKNMKIRQRKVINAIGGSTFGVLLIHANSDAMRQWLWRDCVDCVGHYSLPIGQLVLFSLSTCLSIFFACVLIDRIRIHWLEKPFFKWYDKRFQHDLVA